MGHKPDDKLTAIRAQIEQASSLAELQAVVRDLEPADRNRLAQILYAATERIVAA